MCSRGMLPLATCVTEQPRPRSSFRLLLADSDSGRFGFELVGDVEVRRVLLLVSLACVASRVSARLGQGLAARESSSGQLSCAHWIPSSLDRFAETDVRAAELTAAPGAALAPATTDAPPVLLLLQLLLLVLLLLLLLVRRANRRGDRDRERDCGHGRFPGERNREQI